MRASLAPLMMVLSLLTWATLLIVGFGLIFWADRRGFPVRFAGLGDAIYTAGAAFATLDVPDGTAVRLAAISCAMSGLATVTVVLRLKSRVTLPPAGIAILETYAREKIVERLAAFFDSWEKWAAEVAISHRAFPILMMFRSNDSRCEWLAALGAVMDAAALLDATVADGPAGAKAAAHFMLRTGTRLLCDMAKLFAGKIDETGGSVDEARFDAHRERLMGAGYTLVEDRTVALAQLEERRRGFGPPLAALARRLAIEVDERRGVGGDSSPRGVSAAVEPDAEEASGTRPTPPLAQSQ